MIWKNKDKIALSVIIYKKKFKVIVFYMKMQLFAENFFFISLTGLRLKYFVKNHLIKVCFYIENKVIYKN